MKTRTGLVSSPAYEEHDTGPFHPERPERLRALRSHLESTGLAGAAAVIEPVPASEDWIRTVHTSAHLELVRRTAAAGGGMLDPDTCVSPASFDIALLAAGGLLAAVDAVAREEVSNAFAAVRPPGHHATPGRAMGFCLFNNIAVAARYAQEKHGLRKVLIIDWDVHHGNGTQDAFYRDGDVLYFSVHQFPHYPGTGTAQERGEGAGAGTTINIPLPAGSGDEEYMEAFGSQLVPAAREFAPELVLVSAGFDAHRLDPLSSQEVTEDGFRRMTRCAAGIAEESAGGRLVSTLEGGYDLTALPLSVQAHLEALME